MGGLALGYNVTLSESIELINQLYLDIPQRDDPVAVGLMIGFIATLPSSRCHPTVVTMKVYKISSQGSRFLRIELQGENRR